MLKAAVVGWRRVAMVGLVAGVVASPAWAADKDRAFDRYELTPFIGYMAGGSFQDPQDETDRDLDSGTAFGLVFDIAQDADRHYEFLYTHQSSKLDGAAGAFDMQVQYLQIGGTVTDPDYRHVIPYFGATIGATRFSPDAGGLDDETKLSFSLGGGARVPITDHLALRFDVRGYLTVLDSESDIFCISTAQNNLCRVRVKSDAFLQYSGSLGLTFGF
jgi:opacity protein-like surface antigen